jgi:5'-nucleotidase
MRTQPTVLPEFRSILMKLRIISAWALLCLSSACAVQASTGKSTVNVKLIAINDFHGQIESPGIFRKDSTSTSPTIPVGGIDWFAGYVARAKAENPNTAVVSAGDLIGATPLISALFHDEATIETMNRAGLDVNAVGNHEFDEGRKELLRMQRGGCHPTDPNSCKGAEVGTPVPFEGAHFKFLAANVVDNRSGKTLFRPYVIKEYDDAKIAFIGMTLKDTPSIVTPTGIAGLTFKDEAATVNALVPELRRKRVDAIVVLVHQGGVTPSLQNASTINLCEGGLKGSPIKAIVEQLDDAVDLVISGHTHQAYNCLLPNRAGRSIPVTSANSQGRVLTNIDMSVDRRNHKVAAVSASNRVVDRTDATVVPDADIKAIVDSYRNIAQPIANRVIGSITADLTRELTVGGESALGDVIADAQLAATAKPGFGDAVIALMNPGGIRANLSYASGTAGEGDGNVTYGEAFTVQPFGNSLVTLTLSGEQIHTLLEQQFTGCLLGYPASDTAGQPFNRILQVSSGFSYVWSASGPACGKVDPASIKLNGTVIDPVANYRVTVNNFMADGGDKLYVLTQGTDRLGGAQDIDALEAYLTANAPVGPGPRDRIAQLP